MKKPRVKLIVQNVPAALREHAQWCLWAYVPRVDKRGETYYTKLPLQTNRKAASSTDPATWNTFEAVAEAYKEGWAHGIGYVLSPDRQEAGIDLDQAIEPDTGELYPWAADHVRILNTYAEISPSGNGIRLFLLGALPEGFGGGRRVDGWGEDCKGIVEAYSRARFVTVTGRRLADTPWEIAERNEVFQDWCRQVFPARDKRVQVERSSAPLPALDLSDGELLQRMLRNRTNGPSIQALFNGDMSRHADNHSSADLALCNHLAWWTAGRIDQMDRLFRQSHLMRPKWDEMRGEMTYGQMTLGLAAFEIAAGQGYQPQETAEEFSLEGLSSPLNNGEIGSEDTDRKLEPKATLHDFRAYLPEHKYIYLPSGDLWPAASVNGQVPPVWTGRRDEDGKKVYEAASKWLDRRAAVQQMTWAPGLPELIQGQLIIEGGWIPKPEAVVYNQYRAALIDGGDPKDVKPWWNHLAKVYGDQAEHILAWFAHRVQRPGEKVNHALVLGGAQGIGKDTILEPVRSAIGPWNFADVSPVEILGRFNGFRKSVILRVSEARDLGEIDRYAFYEHLKIYTAAPPDTLRVDEKNRREYSVPNVCGVILTTNHLQAGIFLPPDDRRHFVAWSECTKESFPADYWRQLWSWYEGGGIANVAAYLKTLDISGFNPKAPPPKTDAFYAIVNAGRAPEDGELSDAIEALGDPDVLSKEMLLASDLIAYDFKEWMRERKNAVKFRHRLEAVGYEPVHNPDTKDGRWPVPAVGKVVLYGKKDASIRDRCLAVKQYLSAL